MPGLGVLGKDGLSTGRGRSSKEEATTLPNEYYSS